MRMIGCLASVAPRQKPKRSSAKSEHSCVMHSSWSYLKKRRSLHMHVLALRNSSATRSWSNTPTTNSTAEVNGKSTKRLDYECPKKSLNKNAPSICAKANQHNGLKCTMIVITALSVNISPNIEEWSSTTCWPTMSAGSVNSNG